MAAPPQMEVPPATNTRVLGLTFNRYFPIKQAVRKANPMLMMI